MLDPANSYFVGCSTQNQVILQEMFINLNYILEYSTSILDVKNLHKGYIKLIHVLFSENYSTIRTIFYCTLKIEEILNLTIFVRISFMQLCNISGTSSKYFENNISDTDISSAAQVSTT